MIPTFSLIAPNLIAPSTNPVGDPHDRHRDLSAFVFSGDLLHKLHDVTPERRLLDPRECLVSASPSLDARKPVT
jgi:hypothetical protein